MTDLHPSPSSDAELQQAIRRGVEHGMNAAPVARDLAERVRAGASPRRHWPMVAVAASVVAVLLAVGVGVAVPLKARDVQRPNGSATPRVTATPSHSVGPPYPVQLPSDDQTTGPRALGSWAPVWIADYDGPVMAGPTWRAGPGLDIRKVGAGQDGLELGAWAAKCLAIGAGRLSMTGLLLDHSVPVVSPSCTAIGVATLTAAFRSAAFDRVTRVAVSESGILTTYQGSTPLAQFVRAGQRVPVWSSDGTLPQGLVASWITPPEDPASEPSEVPVQGLDQITLTADGRYSGASRCQVLTGTYSVTADGHASFGKPKVQDHSCPSGPRAVGSLTDIARVAHYGNYLALYDADGKLLLQLQLQVQLAVVGTWSVTTANGLGGLRKVTFAPDGTYTGSDGCHQTNGRYTVHADGAMTVSRPTVTSPYCAQFQDPTAVADIKHVSIVASVMTVYGAGGVVLGHLARVGH